MPGGTILFLRHRFKCPVSYERVGSAVIGQPTGKTLNMYRHSWTGFRLNDRYPVPVPGIRDSVPPTTPGKPGAMTTPGAPGFTGHTR